jgi:hypothetical protein
VSNPGRVLDFDGLGFHAIGSGEMHASQFFVVGKFSPRTTRLGAAIGLTYAAKKRGEKAQSVGEATEMLVISAGGVTRVPRETLDALDGRYRGIADKEEAAIESDGLSVEDTSFIGER